MTVGQASNQRLQRLYCLLGKTIQLGMVDSRRHMPLFPLCYNLFYPGEDLWRSFFRKDYLGTSMLEDQSLLNKLGSLKTGLSSDGLYFDPLGEDTDGN